VFRVRVQGALALEALSILVVDAVDVNLAVELLQDVETAVKYIFPILQP